MIPNGATIGGYHTYTYLKMIPKHKLIVAPPKPKKLSMSVPGKDGEEDYTDILFEEIFYENRKGTWDFLVLSGDKHTQAYKNALALFDGEIRTCILDDAPNKTYRGRFFVSGWKAYEGFCELSVDYNLYPWEVTP